MNKRQTKTQKDAFLKRAKFHGALRKIDHLMRTSQKVVETIENEDIFVQMMTIEGKRFIQTGKIYSLNALQSFASAIDEERKNLQQPSIRNRF